jgi:aryl-alcohol dehydrogenase-like predicted oxidoreductase
VGLIPWSPLARGLLARPRSAGSDATLRSRTDEYGQLLYGELDLSIIDTVQAVATERGIPAAQVALAWLWHKPGVVAPIVGATKLEHIVDAVAATEVSLSADELARLEAPYVPHPVRGHS